MDEQVLRNTHLKARNKLWYVNIAREDKNPYIQRVLEMDKAKDKAATEMDQEKSTWIDLSLILVEIETLITTAKDKLHISSSTLL